ncbi:MAG: lipocalin family protein [Saprospiraceae bacterium]|nr:lipocalin family protein [Saprospiraceae bacterium]
MKYLSVFAFFIFCFANCTADLGYQQAIQGKWQAVNWTTDNGEPRSVENVSFDFNGEAYAAKLGARDEAGSFRLQGDKLYTKAEGQQEIMVKISQLTTDSLVFEMNRGGVQEVLTLKKM